MWSEASKTGFPKYILEKKRDSKSKKQEHTIKNTISVLRNLPVMSNITAASLLPICFAKEKLPADIKEVQTRKKLKKIGLFECYCRLLVKNRL